MQLNHKGMISIPIIQQDNKAVKRLGTFFPVDEDKALQGCNLSAYTGPPFGESVPFLLYPGGRVQSDKPNVPLIIEFCNLDSHCVEDVFPTRLDTCKQVGNTERKLTSNAGLRDLNLDRFNKPIRDENEKWRERFEALKVQREKLADVLAEAGRYKEAQNVRQCGENFIAYKAQCCGDTVAQPMSCGHRLCPVCMKKRSIELSGKVEKLILKMSQPKHIVLTVKNVSKIDKAYFGWLRKCFIKLRHRDIFARCAGGFYSIETTYNTEKKNWHVHIHIVADVPYIQKQNLIDSWSEITKGSFICDIHEIGRDGQSAFEAAKEVAKYIVKPDAFLDDPKLVDEYLKAVKGMRFVSTFGKFYRMALDEEDEGGLPECWCGKNNWVRLDGFYGISDVFRDVQGFYRLKAIISDA